MLKDYVEHLNFNFRKQ
jgi:hypothetical protein